MGKLYQVSEAAEELEMEVYTLRYWENQLGIEVPRNAAGHRYYEEEQLALFRGVKRLKEAGFGLRQIKAMAERMPAVAALPDNKLEDLRRRIAGMEAEQEEAFNRSEPTKEREKFSLCVGQPSTCATAEAEERPEGVKLLQEGMTKWLGEVLQRNNEQLTQQIEEGVSERMARELRFLFRQQEEREEERYRRLDRTIREYQQARANARQQQNGKENFLLTRKVRPLH
ncbi:MAG: helix-turn-helix domain-containing protein [Lachnospiraceae bacterium]